jgi:hypothetical protein
MPGFGINANAGDPLVPQLGAGSMYTPEEVWAIMMYERDFTRQNAVKALNPEATAASAEATADAARAATGRTTTTTTEESQ